MTKPPIVFTDRRHDKQPRWRTLSVTPQRLPGLSDSQHAQRVVDLLLASAPAVGATPHAAARRALRAIMSALGASAGACLLEGQPPRVVAWRIESPRSSFEVHRALLQFTLDNGVTAALGAAAGHPALVCAPLGPTGRRSPGALVLVRDRDFSAKELELTALAARQLGSSLDAALAEQAQARRSPIAQPSPRPRAARRQPAVPRRVATPDGTVTSTLRRVQQSEADSASETRTSMFRRRGEATEPVVTTVGGGSSCTFTARSETRGSSHSAGRGRRETPVRVPLTIEVLFGGSHVLPDYLRDDDA